jgi:hypothetical protein
LGAGQAILEPLVDAIKRSGVLATSSGRHEEVRATHSGRDIRGALVLNVLNDHRGPREANVIVVVGRLRALY